MAPTDSAKNLTGKDSIKSGRKNNKKKVKTPTILQMEALECGAAALAIILAFHGKIVPLEELRVECGITRDGSKASNMVRAAESYNLVAKGYKKEPEELKEMPLPMIIHWNFNHFVVLEGFKKGRVYLNDPVSGPRTVSEEELDMSFTGVAIAFEKGPDFVPGGEKPSMYSALANRMSGSGNAILYAVLVGLLLVIPGLAVPVFTQFFIDEILLGKMVHWLFPLAAGIMLTAFIRAALIWLQHYYLLLMETRLTLSTSGQFFWHVLRLPIDFFARRYVGDVATRVMINDRMAKTVSRDLVSSFLNLMMIIFYVALMFWYSVPLTLVGILIAVLNMVYLRKVSARRTHQNQKLFQEHGKLYGASMSGLEMIESLKAGGIESDFFSGWTGIQAKVTNFEQDFKVSSTYLMLVPGLLQGLNMAIILAVGGLAVINGHITVGMLVAFQFLMTGFITPVNELVKKGGELQELKGDLVSLDDVLRYPVVKQWDDKDSEKTHPGDEEAELPGGKLQGAVSIRNISFGYDKNNPPLIENFSLELKPGERVAFVGDSGSGKSTLSRLITGLVTPWKGEILFDDHNREKIPRNVISASLALVDQDINVFDGTIWDNLTLWDDSVDEVTVARAVRDACAADIISERPGGYKHEIQENGRNFSGGQLQRLEIARALVNNPTILIMDEATSSLDAKTELEVSENIRRRGCTCILIAHRLSTIRDCDEIIVLANGKVAERGNHDELMKKCGNYASLVKNM